MKRNRVLVGRVQLSLTCFRVLEEPPGKVSFAFP